MQNFFARWRIVSAWLTRQVLLAFGAVAVIAAIQVYEMKGPMWVIGLFSAGAVFLFWASWTARRR